MAVEENDHFSNNEGFRSTHGSFEKMDEMYVGLEFVDDVNKMEPLERRKVILERIKEVQYLKKWAYTKRYFDQK